MRPNERIAMVRPTSFCGVVFFGARLSVRPQAPTSGRGRASREAAARDWADINDAPGVEYTELLLADSDHIWLGYSKNNYWTNDEGMILHPTHWMPLPELLE